AGAPPAPAADLPGTGGSTPPPGAPPRPPTPGRPWMPGAEQWIGQRGLLAVGVLALILAAGYLLKLAFERGWISPTMRCAGGVAAGLVVGALGWRMLERYRTYGASLIGCGAAIIYLALWAAARLYGLVPPTSGIAALALTSIALAAIAFAIDVQALGTTAAIGALFAPVLLGRDRAHADLLLLYLGCVGIGLGAVAALKRWRGTSAVVAVSYFGLGWAAAAQAAPLGALAYAIVGGAGGIALGLRERWWETRFLAFWGSWALLGTVSPRIEPHWPIVAAAVVLAAPVWRYALANPVVRPIRIVAASGPQGWLASEALYFFVTPMLVGWAVGRAVPEYVVDPRGIAALVVAAAYLAAGYGRPRPVFAVVGAAGLAWAVLDRWSGVAAPAALLALAVGFAAADHALERSDGRWYAALALAGALLHLLDHDLPARPPAEPAFVGPWALVLWLALGVSVALAAGLFRRTPDGDGPRLTRAGLWLVAGALALFGVTGEIDRWFRQAGLDPGTADLAGGLAVSAWWLLFAAALVVTGLRRGVRPARLGGLAVAGLAIAKVLLFDLSSLDALYRVASVFILGLVSLVLAYLYHRQARTSGP
ncbi:MAG TPA: DUF2339 domain-containing protein, partial [Gemmatimonadales bacterium]|nr:DUF2339 domain-containing protein [Gemmatimonadales bacterium]